MSTYSYLRPDVVTFDCYGTLIDWETGIRNAFHRALKRGKPQGVKESQIFQLYEEEEKRIENELPYRPYRQVLAEAMRAAANKVGWSVPEEESDFLARALPNWKPFPDTNPALNRLEGKYTLGILSNIDNDLLAGTLKHLSGSFQIIVTAEQVHSYKPQPAHFEWARRMIGKDKLWIHVAASLFHDIQPAQKLGIRTVWVNRKATTDASYSNNTVNGLAELPDWLEA